VRAQELFEDLRERVRRIHKAESEAIAALASAVG
jgi:hypothetical protein